METRKVKKEMGGARFMDFFDQVETERMRERQTAFPCNWTTVCSSLTLMVCAQDERPILSWYKRELRFRSCFLPFSVPVTPKTEASG